MSVTNIIVFTCAVVAVCGAFIAVQADKDTNRMTADTLLGSGRDKKQHKEVHRCNYAGQGFKLHADDKINCTEPWKIIVVDTLQNNSVTFHAGTEANTTVVVSKPTPVIIQPAMLLQCVRKTLVLISVLYVYMYSASHNSVTKELMWLWPHQQPRPMTSRCC